MITNEELIVAEVPKYKELSTKVIWPCIKDNEMLKQYFPNLTPNQLPNRDYMWNILSSVKPWATHSLIEHALKNRSVENEEEKEDLIEMAPEYVEKLMNVATYKIKDNIETQ